MCGIAGIFTQQINESHHKLIQAILTSQHNRGPDHQASLIINNSIVLAHNRLSIIDLSINANQPMWDAKQRFCITFNGEIYNYRELRVELHALGHITQTDSDTEIILLAFKQWGIAALEKFNGPFAFALYDNITDTLWLCRDRFGVKPLYYCWLYNTLYFASTTKALAQALGFNKNLQYAARGLHYRIYEDYSDIAPYEHIKALLPAHALCVTKQGEHFQEKLIKYYDLTQRVTDLSLQLQTNNIKELLEQGLQQLIRAIQWRLRADVAVGISLSGGLDSASIAALAAKQQSLLAFSYGHPDIKKSEAPLVAQLVKHTNNKVHYVAPNAKEFLLAMQQTLQAQDAPFPSASIVAQYLVFQTAKQQQIKVLLGGQGGDEAFMGYRKFHWFYLQEQLKQKNYLASLMHIYRLLPTVLAEISQFNLYWQQRQRYFAKTKQQTANLLLPEIAPMQLHLTAHADLRQRQIADVMQFSLPTLLRYEDRNSLGNSVESRLPFMDYQVMEFGLALPAALKLHRGYGKWPIRAIMQGMIPNSICHARYKRGFDVGLAQLIDEGLGEGIRQLLLSNWDNLKHFLAPHIKIAEQFSNAQFKQHAAAFAEAITLLWLAE